MADEQAGSRLRVLLVDPSLFTDPYNAALTDGLVKTGCEVAWATRPVSAQEELRLPRDRLIPCFYQGLSGSGKAEGAFFRIQKGLSHFRSLARLKELSAGYDVVHFQWLMLPLFDLPTIKAIARDKPVVITVHDSEPFNSDPTSRVQVIGYDKALAAATGLIVHTDQAADRLEARGMDRKRITVIPHGPIAVAPAQSPAQSPPRADERWTITLFGKIQHYKGADLLIEAAALLDAETRRHVRIIIAGEPFIGLDPLGQAITRQGLEATVDLRPARLSEAEMGALFAETDCFVFPYRNIDASGVYQMIKSRGTWIVASDLGVFRQEITPTTGSLVPANDPPALARALEASVAKRPSGMTKPSPGWEEIAQKTVQLYRRWKTTETSAA